MLNSIPFFGMVYIYIYVYSDGARGRTVEGTLRARSGALVTARSGDTHGLKRLEGEVAFLFKKKGVGNG